WQSKFDALEQKGARKLVKKTGMTYAYNVTVIGATRQVAEEYYKLRQNSRPPEGGFKYLAEKILEACAQLLPGPAAIMEYIGELSEYCTSQRRFMQCSSPTGFPFINIYQIPNVEIVDLKGPNGARIRHKVANGATEEIDRDKAIRSAAP